MLNDTHRQLQEIAGDAGWDSFTLLILIAHWTDTAGQSRPLLDHLAHRASDEDAAVETI